MSLKEYKNKRKFTSTPEPQGSEEATLKGPLTYVIQKHAATRLHYDFRLEFNGVLLSWAIPKGPSLNPHDRHLAVKVEDHPKEYAHFEGIIPQGNYGAGSVTVWDYGVYTPYDSIDRKSAEKIIEKQLKDGHLTFILLGKKLKGEYALIKTRNSEENAWILIKKGDDFSSQKKDILKDDKSALTGRTMKEIAEQANKKNEVWYSKPKILDTQEAQSGEIPHAVKPMLANTATKPFDRENWVFEIKYDGYRAISEIEKGKVKIYSRNGISYNKKFSLLVQSLQKFPGTTVIDGEIVVVDSLGHPRFQWLQDFPNDQGELIYFVFDILFLDGKDLTKLPLKKRKEILKQILPPLPHIKFSRHIKRSGIAMYQQAKELGIEGIIAKNAQSIYRLGRRTDDWLKIKAQNRQEVVIAGYTEPKGSRQYFGSLIAGLYKKNKLTYIGHIGTGFDDKRLKEIYHKLSALKQASCPFKIIPQTNAPVTWIEPKILAEVSFLNWTKDGQMRHPVFLGLREDKNATDFKKDPEIKIGKQKVSLTHHNKIFYPQEKITKGDLISYYREMSPLILPYLKNRPESLLRYPNGINGNSFYQKDASLLHEDWLPTTKVFSDSNGKYIEYLLCQDEATLVYLINLGCIDLNPWNSRVEKLEHPDYLIIDLDPEKVGFDVVVEAALATRLVLEKLNITSYPKTSGATGIHMYIPLGAKYTYDQTRQLAELLCITIHNTAPNITSLERSPKKRQGLVYLDFLQNRKGQTLASVYSVRARPGATVSTPLEWSEVTAKLHPSQFTIKNIPERIQKKGDLFEGVMNKGIDIKKVLKAIAQH